MKLQPILSIAVLSLSCLSIAPDAIAKEGCRNVNDDVHECRERKQGKKTVKGYVSELAIAFRTMPPEPQEKPRRIKIAGFPKAESSDKDKKKGDKAYRGSGRLVEDAGQYS